MGLGLKIYPFSDQQCCLANHVAIVWIYFTVNLSWVLWVMFPSVPVNVSSSSSSIRCMRTRMP